MSIPVARVAKPPREPPKRRGRWYFPAAFLEEYFLTASGLQLRGQGGGVLILAALVFPLLFGFAVYRPTRRFTPSAFPDGVCFSGRSGGGKDTSFTPAMYWILGGVWLSFLAMAPSRAIPPYGLVAALVLTWGGLTLARYITPFQVFLTPDKVILASGARIRWEAPWDIISEARIKGHQEIHTRRLEFFVSDRDIGAVRFNRDLGEQEIRALRQELISRSVKDPRVRLSPGIHKP